MKWWDFLHPLFYSIGLSPGCGNPGWLRRIRLDTRFRGYDTSVVLFILGALPYFEEGRIRATPFSRVLLELGVFAPWREKIVGFYFTSARAVSAMRSAVGVT
jgi:hypothetical protein